MGSALRLCVSASLRLIPSSMRSLLVCLIGAILATGCAPAGPKVAKVGGRVTLDGKPLAKASVTFVPMASKEKPNPGPTAQGMTDDEGRYQLSLGTDDAAKGAIVGPCRIYITTLLSDPILDDRDAGGPRPKARDR